MVGTSLRKNFFRGFKRNIVQLLSIIIMLTLGIAVFIGLDSTWRSLQQYVDEGYKKDNIADLTIYSDLVPKGYFEKLKDIKGIEDLEENFQVIGEVENLEGRELETNFIESNNINKFSLIEGSKDFNKNECVLDYSFANSNNIKINDIIKLKINGVSKEFKVKGLAVSSAYIYLTPDATAVIPDHNKFGFVYINIEDSKEFFKNNILTNKIIIKKEKNSDIDIIKEEIEKENQSVVKGILKREETLNYLATNQKVEQYKSIGRLFPVVFFAIVILMTFTTMYRIINKERQTIGIFKSLGYSSRKILLHYSAYGLWISIIGVTLGIIIGWKVVPSFIWRFFEELFVFENAKIIVSYTQICIVSIISLFSTLFAIIYVFSKTDKEKPADLLRDKKISGGRNILIERFNGYWKRKTPSEKLTLRQMFLNKIRVLMTIIGVMGCTALLLSAMGIRDTVDNVAKSVYNKTYLYNEKIYIDNNKITDDIKDMVSKSQNDEFVQELSLSISSNTRKKMGSVSIIEDNSNLIKFYDDKGTVINVDQDDLLITEKISEIYSLNIGDNVEMRINNKSKIFKVTKITKINIGQGFYLTKTAWENSGEEFRPTLILKGDNDVKYNDDIINKSIITKNQENDFIKSMSSTISMSLMLIFAAVCLAIVVLYNLGVLNFFDRERDLATLSVLGFYDKELKKFLSIENILLSIVGIFLGIPIGVLMHKKIFENAGMGDELDFTALIYLKSFIIAVIFVFTIVIIVNLVLRRKVEKINMTEALKSVE